MNSSRNIAVCRLLRGFYPEIGGIANHSHELSKCLAQHGVPLSVVCNSYNGCPRFEQVDGFEIHRMPLSKGPVNSISRASYHSMGLLWLIRNQSKYNILQCHSLFSGTLLGISAKKLAKNKKLVVTVHMADKFSEVDGLKKKPLAHIRLGLLSEVDHFATVNPFVPEELRSIGIPEEKISHIPNGVIIPDEASYNPSVKQKYRKLLGLDAEKIVVSVGRLSAEKNLDILLHAWKRISVEEPMAHLLILGSGGDFRNVEAEIRQLSVDLKLNESVHFMGHVDDVLSYLLAADVFVLISSSEGMSNALLEAMAAGIGIITSDVPGNAHLISNEKTGLLVRPNQVAETVTALNRFLKEPRLCESFGKAVRQKAMDEYSINSVAERYIELYRRVLSV